MGHRCFGYVPTGHLPWQRSSLIACRGWSPTMQLNAVTPLCAVGYEQNLLEYIERHRITIYVVRRVFLGRLRRVFMCFCVFMPFVLCMTH